MMTQATSEDELHDWMLGEFTGEIDGTGVQAAWIKLSAGDDGITPCERKILRAGQAAARLIPIRHRDVALTCRHPEPGAPSGPKDLPA